MLTDTDVSLAIRFKMPTTTSSAVPMANAPSANAASARLPRVALALAGGLMVWSCLPLSRNHRPFPELWCYEVA